MTSWAGIYAMMQAQAHALRTRPTAGHWPPTPHTHTQMHAAYIVTEILRFGFSDLADEDGKAKPKTTGSVEFGGIPLMACMMQ